MDAFIPASYIVNEFQKLDIYKRIAGIENKSESEDMKEELLDRFGEIPKSVDNLLRIALIRVQARKLYMPEVRGKNGQIRFILNRDAKIRVENIPIVLSKYPRLNFQPKGTPEFIFRYKKCGMVERDAEMLLGYTEELLGAMGDVLV